MKKESLGNALLLFSPLIPGGLWIFLLEDVLIYVVHHSWAWTWTLWLSGLSILLYYPIYAVLFYRRELGDRAVYPVLLYLSMSLLPILAISTGVYEWCLEPTGMDSGWGLLLSAVPVVAGLFWSMKRLTQWLWRHMERG